MDEAWKAIPFATSYEASTLGRIRRCKDSKTRKAGGILSFSAVGKRLEYLKTQIITDDGKRMTALAHRLIALTFLGNQPEGCDVGHIDGNPHNNNVNNLKWCTKIENTQDQRMHGTLIKGEKCGNSKLKESQARAIKEDCRKAKAIAEEYKISTDTVYKIKNGKLWYWL